MTPPLTSRTLLRCGAQANYVDGKGTVWAAENRKNLIAGTSKVRTYTKGVAGTTDDALYQTQREGSSFGYAIPVPNGTYSVGVWYSELGYTSAGKRSFNVTVEGTVGVMGFDPWASVGSTVPFRGWYGDWSVTPPVTQVKDGILNIEFAGKNAICQAIEIVPVGIAATPTPSVTPSRNLVRCGAGTNYVDQAGTKWAAENPSYLTAGTSTVRTYTKAVEGTTDDVLYQTQREGFSFGYAIPVPNGTYSVGVWYSEPGYTSAGNRNFSVTVEGVVGINGFDPWGSLGNTVPFRGWYGNWNFTPPTTVVTDGILNVDFKGTNAICQAIEFVKVL